LHYYIIDRHPEYGTLGFLLNKPSGKLLGDENLHPELKFLRNRPVYFGGVQNRGSSFTMIHQKPGFPENRKWKTLPDAKDFTLYFSPELAMANELCSTNDASPKDFKFFQWATVWSPNQLELEYKKRLWITVKAPVKLLFEDETSSSPLWKRIVCSFPKERLE